MKLLQCKFPETNRETQRRGKNMKETNVGVLYVSTSTGSEIKPETMPLKQRCDDFKAQSTFEKILRPWDNKEES